MFKITLFVLLLRTVLALPKQVYDAPACTSACVLPDCRCASTTPPGDLTREETPQFIHFTFDDAVQTPNYEVYTEVFYNRTNPDGCPVQVTYYVSHEYTDYTQVHDLYVHNHEIALHSITHEALTDYWKNLTVEGYLDEFADEKTLIANFANIPEESLLGMRVPFLQLSGDNSFEAARQAGILYDCTWPTQTFRNPGLWPYTLDYKSNQDCPIGPCPVDSIPGVWVVPMIDWTDQSNNVCSMIDACIDIPEDDSDELLQWFIDNFNVQYQGNRAPLGFYVQSGYITANPVRLEAYQKFVDYLQGLNDVFLVAPTRTIEWIRNPVAVGSSNWPACEQVEDAGCTPITCPLFNGDDPNPIYMTFCGSQCPSVYPWLGNPLGEVTP